MILGAEAQDQPHLKECHAWFNACLAYLDGELASARERSSSDLDEAEGMLTNIPAGDVQKFYNQVTGTRLIKGAAEHLKTFVESLRFKARVIPTPQAGVVSYVVTVPDCMKNLLVTDASYGISERSTLDASMKNAEEHHPMLKNLRAWYGKGLHDLKDYSDHQLWHLDMAGGKKQIGLDLLAYVDGKAEGGNVVLEVMDLVKEFADQGRKILIWMHKSDQQGNNLVKLTYDALEKVGCDLTKEVEDPYTPGNPKRPQIAVEHYGRHDANNGWTYV